MASVRNYYSVPSLHQYFYSEDVEHIINDLGEFLGLPHQLHIFPDATIKKNKIPNGVLIKSKRQDTLLMPSILRDPGCGFLLFKLHSFPHNSISLISQSVLEFCNKLEQQVPKISDELAESLIYGVSNINKHNNFFSHTGFPIDLGAFYTDLNIRELSADLSQITNTLELKIPTEGDCLKSPKNPDSLIGLIHTGSEYFPKIIIQEWFKIAAEHTYFNQLASVSQINQGLYGLPASGEFGYAYQQCLKSAMNYCLYKRWWIFNQLRDFLQSRMSIKVSLINDHIHAGLFEIIENETVHLIQTRGVQLLHDKNFPYLMAGQRESISYLISIDEQKSFHIPEYLCHGTSYQFNEQLDYVALLGVHASKFYNKQLDKIQANSTLEKDKCLAYNYNINIQKEYLTQFNLNFVSLTPLLNYHGRYLRKAQV